MKWGKKKSWPSPSHTSVITSVFSGSWFSKFKYRKGGSNSETSRSNYSTDRKQSGKLDFPTPNSSVPSSNWKEGRFYSMDGDDPFWRLSFTDERIEGRRSTGGINPSSYDDPDDECRIPIWRFKSFGPKEMEFQRREENLTFNDMVSDIKKMKDKQKKETVPRLNPIRNQRVNVEEEMMSHCRNGATGHKCSRRAVRENQEEAERDIYGVEPENMVRRRSDFRRSPVSIEHHKISFPRIDPSPKEEDYAFHAISDRVSISEWQNSQDSNFLKEISVKTGRRIKQNTNGSKAHSPRTECKIRALEDMKKERMKLKIKKKKEKEEMVYGKTVFDSIPVAKNSFNPQRDFRDSMVEMIKLKGIRRPEELEELLACYLTLNRDEYHDIIIKVFRQVWFDLNEISDDPEIHNSEYFYDSEIV